MHIFEIYVCVVTQLYDGQELPMKNPDFSGTFSCLITFHLCSVVISLSLQSTLILLNQNKFLNETQVKSDHPNQNPIFNPDCGDLFASKNSALQQSHDKVDFHVLFQDKPRSLSFTTNTFASTQLSLSIVLFFTRI